MPNFTFWINIWDIFVGPDPIEEKGWIYPTESTKPIASAPDEFRLTPYHSLQISTIKGTPEAEST